MLLSEIAAFCATHPNGRRRVKPATVRIYETAVHRLIDFFGDTEAEDLTRADLADWQSYLESRAETNVTSDNTYKRTIRAIWHYLKKRGLAVCDVTGLFTFKKEIKGVKSISVKNARTMLAYSGIRETAIILMANESACRRGGLATMRKSKLRIWEDEKTGEFCLAAQVIEKGDKPRWVFGYHLSALAMLVWLRIRDDYIESLGIPDHGYVFINLRDGSPLSPQAMSANNSRIKQKANIPADQPCNLHAHRHFRAKELLKTLSLDEVSDILGHEDISTTAVYTERGEEELADAFFRARPKR